MDHTVSLLTSAPLSHMITRTAARAKKDVNSLCLINDVRAFSDRDEV